MYRTLPLAKGIAARKTSSSLLRGGIGTVLRINLAKILAPHVDGVVIGSALVEALERGDDVGAFLQSLR